MRDGKMKVTPGTMDVLLAGVDAVKELLAAIEQTSGEGSKDYSDVVKKLERVANCDAPGGKVISASAWASERDQLGAVRASAEDCGFSGPFFARPTPFVAAQITAAQVKPAGSQSARRRRA